MNKKTIYLLAIAMVVVTTSGYFLFNIKKSEVKSTSETIQDKKQISTLEDIISLIDNGCLDDLGPSTNSLPRFSIKSPVDVDKYKDWNLYKFNSSNGDYLSFAYPKDWKVEEMPNRVSIISSSENAQFFVSKANFTKDELNGFVRNCYGVKGPLHVQTRLLSNNISFQPILIDNDVVYEFYDGNTGKWYLLRGASDTSMFVVELPDENSFNNPVIQEIISTFGYRGGEELPFFDNRLITKVPTRPSSLFHKEFASPNGKYIAVTDAAVDSSTTYVIDLDGNPITDAYKGYFVRWSDDNDKILVNLPGYTFNGLTLNYPVYLPIN